MTKFVKIQKIAKFLDKTLNWKQKVLKKIKKMKTKISEKFKKLKF